jgi:hypothetical protein
MANEKKASIVKEDNIHQRTLQHHIFDSFHLVSSLLQPEELETVNIHLFRIDGVLSYISFSDDFGPMNLGSIYQFCNIVESELLKRPGDKTGLFSSLRTRDLTNAVFLIGAYLIMKRNWLASDVEKCFEPINDMLASYRDVSPGAQNFSLYVRDCWEGLWRSKCLGWANFDPGEFDLVRPVPNACPILARVMLVSRTSTATTRTR